jgi:hypothetical protein
MLTQQQLLLASQLFIAAGKAGHPFDLSKFSNDRGFAIDVLSRLSANVSETAVLALVAKMTLALAEEAPKSVEPAQPASGTPPVVQEEAPKQYVGRLR